MTPAILNTDQAAIYLSISLKALKKSQANKRIFKNIPSPPYILFGNKIRYKKYDLDIWVEKLPQGIYPTKQLFKENNDTLRSFLIEDIFDLIQDISEFKYEKSMRHQDSNLLIKMGLINKSVVRSIVRRRRKLVRQLNSINSKTDWSEELDKIYISLEDMGRIVCRDHGSKHCISLRQKKRKAYS